MKNLLENLFDRLEFGTPQSCRNLNILPLFDGLDRRPEYLSLKEGLDRQLLEISEVSESGSVPNLQVSNRADQPIILVDGEELVGAKQNRIVNTSVLLGAHTETIIPVSCTEQGRWQYNSRQFQDSDAVVSTRARYGKSQRVAASLRSYSSFDAGQGEVWQDINSLHQRAGTHSNTRAMRDAFVQRKSDIEDYVSAFPLQPQQKGMIVFLNGQLLGADYLSRCDAYGQLHEKLIRSHAIEALTESGGKSIDMNLLSEGRSFLRSLLDAQETDQHKAVGLGEDHRLSGPLSEAAVLVYEDTPIHLTAYHPSQIQPQNGLGGRSWRLSNRIRPRSGA